MHSQSREMTRQRVRKLVGTVERLFAQKENAGLATVVRVEVYLPAPIACIVARLAGDLARNPDLAERAEILLKRAQKQWEK